MKARWRKSSFSEGVNNCVEVAWRKAAASAGANNCVEVAHVGAVRDSKNPGGAVLRVDLGTLLTAVKGGWLDR